MKRSLLLSIFALNLIMLPGAYASFTESFKLKRNTQTNSSESQDSFKVEFFRHNGPNIEEFSEGRTLVSETVNNILEQGFSPKQNLLMVGIAPRGMRGGHVVQVGDTLYVSIGTTESNLEKKLLNFFQYDNHPSSKIRYILHNQPTMEQFFTGLQLVNRVLAKITDAGYEMNREELLIGICPAKMTGGHTVYASYGIYVSITATEDLLERKLLKFFKWPN